MAHHRLFTDERIHAAFHTVEDATGRIALAATLTINDIGRAVIQKDTNALYVCTAAATLTAWPSAAHAASHENGGGDEISVAGLSGVLADAQTAAVHAPSHENGGGDEVSVAGLSGLLADGQTPVDHDHTGDAGDGAQLEADLALLGTGDSAGDLLAAVGDNSVAWLAPGTGLYVWFDITYAAEGAVEVATGALRFYAPIALTIDKVYIAVNTAPTDASLIVDVHKNGVTIFTDQGKRPTIVTTEFVDESDTPDITALAKNDYVTIDIDQVGSSVAGSDLTVHIRCKQFLQIA